MGRRFVSDFSFELSISVLHAVVLRDRARVIAVFPKTPNRLPEAYRSRNRLCAQALNVKNDARMVQADS